MQLLGVLRAIWHASTRVGRCYVVVMDTKIFLACCHTSARMLLCCCQGL